MLPLILLRASGEKILTKGGIQTDNGEKKKKKKKRRNTKAAISHCSSLQTKHANSGVVQVHPF